MYQTENKPRAPREVPSRARATAIDRARVEALDLADAMVDPDFAALVDHDASGQDEDLVARGITLPSTVIDYFGEAMSDLAPGHASHHYSLTETLASGHGFARDRAYMYRLKSEWRSVLVTKCLRRSIAWHRAEIGAADIGDISYALECRDRAAYALGPLRSLGIKGDRGPIAAMCQTLALALHLQPSPAPKA